MQTYLTFEDLLKASLVGQQQKSDPEISPGMNFSDVKAFQEGELVKAGTETDLPKGAELPKISVFGIEFEQAASKYAKDAGRFDTAKIPLENMKEILIKVGKTGMEKGLPEDVIMKDMQNYMNRFGYTEQMLHPESARVSEIDDRFNYFTNRPNPLPSFKLLSDLTGSLGGAIGGAKIGAKIGRIFGLPGAAVGSVLGGTAGLIASLANYEGLITDLNNKGLLYSPTFDEFGDMIGYEKGVNRPSKEEMVDYLKKEAMFDAAFGGSLVAFRPALGLFKAGFNKLVGVDTRVYDKLKAIGVDPGRAEVSSIPIINSFPNTFGRIPFFGPTFQKAYLKNAEKYVKKGEGLVPGFKDLVEAANGGPATSLAMMGVNVREAFLAANAKAIDDVVKNYNIATDIGRQMGKAFDQRELKLMARPMQKIIENYKDLSPSGGDKAAFKIIDELLDPKNPEFSGDFIGYDRYKALRGAIGKAIAEMTEEGQSRTWKEGVDELLKLQKAMDKIGANPIMPQGADVAAFGNLKDGFLKQLKFADDEYVKTVTLFGGTTKRNFKGVGDYYIEDQIRLGGDFTNDLFSKAFKINSPEASETMYQIFKKVDGGEKLFSDAVSFKVGKAFRDSFISEGAEKFGPRQALDDLSNLRFSPEKFRKELGLDQFASLDNASLLGLKQALNRAGLKGADGQVLDVDTLRDFTNASAVFFNNKNFNMSTFLARRAQIGGVKSVLRSITGGGLAAGAGALTLGPLNTLIAVILARKTSQIFANPFLIRPFTEAMKDANSGKYLTNPKSFENLARALESYFDNNPEVLSDIENDFNIIQSKASAKRIFNTGSINFSNKSAINNAKFLSNSLGNIKDKVAEMGGTMIPITSPKVEQPSNNVKVPGPEEVAKLTTPPSVPNIDEFINQPLVGTPNAKTARALFPQDELLSASLERGAV